MEALIYFYTSVGLCVLPRRAAVRVTIFERISGMRENIVLDAIERPIFPMAEAGYSRHNMNEIYRSKSAVYKQIKRLMDVLLSTVALIVLLPVFLVTAIAIKCEDNGPIFFAQQRAGKDMKPFYMYKFRSMYVNAEERMNEMMKDNEQTGHAFKIKNDPRITKIGKVIRRLSIDELPQLINIIKGDMSIVGPRPILMFQMEECSPYERQRLVVQPGLTCYWQIGGRAGIKWEEWVELDLDYIENMSLWTDIKMIAKTIPAVLCGDGAY